MTNYNTIEEINDRLDEIEIEIFNLEMADVLWGHEKERWERLCNERNTLYAMLKAKAWTL